MVIVRCTGACAALRLVAWERATARSIEVAVASRCAAAMKASASCALSVPSAWRRRAAMRANILLLSVMNATLGHGGDSSALPVSEWREVVERADQLWGQRLTVGVVGDVVGGVVLEHVADAVEVQEIQPGVGQRGGQGLDDLTRRLPIRVAARQQHRRARRDEHGERNRGDRVE